MSESNTARVETSVATPSELFEVHISELLKSQPAIAREIAASYQFTITGENGGYWYIDLTKPEAEVGKGQLECPRVSVTISAQDFVDLSFGKLNPQLAFMTGRLKVKGELALALKLRQIIVTVKTTD
jgi:putative sterol carrier protein